MIVFELPTAHRANSSFVMRDIAGELLNIQQQLRDHSVYGYGTDEMAQLDARREELHVLYDAIIRQRACNHIYND
jgi:hypothetical protein